MLFPGGMSYAWMGLKLARGRGPRRRLRPAVGAVGAPQAHRRLGHHDFDPGRTDEPVTAWEAGLARVFIRIAGGFVAPWMHCLLGYFIDAAAAENEDIR